MVGRGSRVWKSAQEGANEAGPRIAVVGTGMAAVMCTRSLARMVKGEVAGLRNARVTLCTSRGKLATQMGPKNQTNPQPGKPFFDYGCQYFTASDPSFQKEVEYWQSLGFVSALGDGAVGVLSKEQGFEKTSAGEKCWVGNGGMGPMLNKIIENTAKEFTGIVEHVAGFPDSNMAVKKLARTSHGWELGCQGGEKLGPFDFVIGGFAQHVLTDPFLLSGGHASEQMLKCLRRVESNQLIPIQVSFEGDPIPADFTAAHVYGEESLGFVMNNSKKPQQNGKMGTPGPQHWTLLSTASFAETEFNTNPKGYRRTAEEKMFSEFSRLLGLPSLSKHRPAVNRINHWEDGLAAKTPPNSRGCLFDVGTGLGWCGDFCVMPGIEGAAMSGQAMATTLRDFVDQGGEFDQQGLLPADVDWVAFQTRDATMVDIGAFSSKLGLEPNWTHTDLVPSAIGGYNPDAHTGAAGRANGVKGKGKNNSNGGYKGGKGKGKGKGYGRGDGGWSANRW